MELWKYDITPNKIENRSTSVNQLLSQMTMVKTFPMLKLNEYLKMISFEMNPARSHLHFMCYALTLSIVQINPSPHPSILAGVTKGTVLNLVQNGAFLPC